MSLDRRTDQQAYFPIEMQFYISVMFLGFPDKYTKKNLHLYILKITGYGRTDGRTDGRRDRRTDGRTNPLIEMRGRI